MVLHVKYSEFVVFHYDEFIQVPLRCIYINSGKWESINDKLNRIAKARTNRRYFIKSTPATNEWFFGKTKYAQMKYKSMIVLLIHVYIIFQIKLRLKIVLIIQPIRKQKLCNGSCMNLPN